MKTLLNHASSFCPGMNIHQLHNKCKSEYFTSIPVMKTHSFLQALQIFQGRVQTSLLLKRHTNLLTLKKKFKRNAKPVASINEKLPNSTLEKSNPQVSNDLVQIETRLPVIGTGNSTNYGLDSKLKSELKSESTFDHLSLNSFDKLKDITSNYVPLHVHSDFSLLDGASQLPSLVSRAKELGMPALALTDHGVMYGAIQLVKLCKQNDIKPIIGNEMYLIHGDIMQKAKKIKRYHLTVLAKNNMGYSNLVELTTMSQIDGIQGSGIFARPCINRELLEKHSNGLIICSGCQSSEICQAILNNNFEEALQTALWYKSVFKDDYYLELMNHKREENIILNNQILKISALTNIKVVATNDSHFTYFSDFHSHKALICIQTNGKLQATPRIKYSGEEYLKSGEEIYHLFENQIGLEKTIEAISSTYEIAEKVENYDLFHESQLPDFEVPENYNEKTWLDHLAWNGLCKRLNCTKEKIPKIYSNRLIHELNVIHNQGFSAYFLIVADMIEFAKKEKILVGPGRGSAAGSLVAYSLSIIGINPVKYGLLFERFLNDERKSLPDIDSDFCPLKRNKILEYLSSKYGKDRVAQIITFNRLTSRAVLKDVGRVMGISFQETHNLSKMVPTIRGRSEKLNNMISDNSPSQEFKRLYDEDEQVHEWVDMAKTLEGTNKTCGVHAAGVVISPHHFSLKQVVPLQRALGNPNSIITQYSMEDIDSMGLLKFDILGLKNLTCIDLTYQYVLNSYGIKLPEMENLPFDDKKTFELLSNGQLEGIFQLEASPGMKRIVKKLKPNCLEEIFALVALYRPGPLDAGLVDVFIDRKHGIQKVEYETAELEPILKETYGVLLYQEQIMEVAKSLAGYSLGQADILRRAMGKKKVAEMEAQREKFAKGAKSRNISIHVANSLFEQMVKFAEYCFNKSHSAAYGMITYITAYLKTNYTVAYMAALLSCAIGENDTLHRYIACLHGMRVDLLSPCVNSSSAHFTVASINSKRNTYVDADMAGEIRYGLLAIRHVGEAAVNALVESREKDGDFLSLPDLCVRVDKDKITKKCFETLILSGAMDCFIDNLNLKMDSNDRMNARHQLLHQLERTLAWTKARDKLRSQNQNSLFDLISNDSGSFQEASHIKNCKNFIKSSEPILSAERAAAHVYLQTVLEKDKVVHLSKVSDVDTDTPKSTEDFLRIEKDLLGFYLSGHPLVQIRQKLPAWMEILDFCDLTMTEEVDRGDKFVACMLTCFARVERKKKKNGQPMAVIHMEDCHSSMEACIFPPLSFSILPELREKGEYLIWGEVNLEDHLMNEKPTPGTEKVKVIIKGIADVAEAEYVCIDLNLNEANDVYRQKRLKDFLMKESGAGNFFFGQEKKIASGIGKNGFKIPAIIGHVPVVARIWNGKKDGGQEEKGKDVSEGAGEGEGEDRPQIVKFGYLYNVVDAKTTAKKLISIGFKANAFNLLNY